MTSSRPRRSPRWVVKWKSKGVADSCWNALHTQSRRCTKVLDVFHFQQTIIGLQNKKTKISQVIVYQSIFHGRIIHLNTWCGDGGAMVSYWFDDLIVSFGSLLCTTYHVDTLSTECNTYIHIASNYGYCCYNFICVMKGSNMQWRSMIIQT